MYNIRNFGRMIVDAARREAYLGALEAAIDPSSRVLDLGAGTGFFTLAALGLGAREVVAVEMMDAIELLPGVVRDNGFESRCQIYRGDVRELDIGTFDLIISDLRGVGPLYGNHLEVIDYANKHLLSDGGVLLPLRDRLGAALIAAPEERDRRIKPWHVDEYSYAPYEHSSLTAPGSLRESSPTVLTEPVIWAEIDYRCTTSLEQRHFGGSFQSRVTQDGAADGIVYWFEASITEDHHYSTKLGDSDPTYGRLYLPFKKELTLTEGEQVSLSIEAMKIGGDYAWRWGASAGLEVRGHSSLDQQIVPGQPSASLPSDIDQKRVQQDIEVLKLLGRGVDSKSISDLLVERDPRTDPEHALRTIERLRGRYVMSRERKLL